MRPILYSLAALALGPFLSHSVAAQAVIQLQSVQLKGKVGQIVPGSMEIVCDDGARWMVNMQGRLGPNVKLNAPPTFTVRGTGHAGALAPGMTVRFSTQADKRNRLPNELTEVQIFSPTAATQYGVFASSAAAPAEVPLLGEKPLGTELHAVSVVGKVQSVKNDALSLLVPGGAVKAKLAAGAVVTLESSDPTMVQPGDLVTATVAYATAPQGVATVVEFQLAQTLGGEVNAKPKRSPLVKPPGEKKPETPLKPEIKAPEKP